MAMTQLLIVWCVLYQVFSSQVSPKCAKSNRAYHADQEELVVNGRPLPPNPWQTCDMLTLSCCNIRTEFYMKQRAASAFPSLLLATVNDKLKKFTEFIDSFSDVHEMIYRKFEKFYVAGNGTVSNHSTMLFSRLIVSHLINDSCQFEKTIALDLTGSSFNISSIIEELLPLYSVLGGVESALKAMSTEPLASGCIEKVMKSGMFTGSTFDRVMCQVCHKDTSHLLPCKNTCTNVARGCLGSLAGIDSLLSHLASAFSDNKMIARFRNKILRGEEFLKELETYVQTSFHHNHNITSKETCWKGLRNLSLWAKTGPFFEIDGLLSSLLNIIEQSADYACLAAVSNKDCWTDNGFVRSENSGILSLEEAEVQAEKNLTVLRVESFLRGALDIIQHVSRTDSEDLVQQETGTDDSVETLVVSNFTFQSSREDDDEYPCSSLAMSGRFNLISVCTLIPLVFNFH